MPGIGCRPGRYASMRAAAQGRGIAGRRDRRVCLAALAVLACTTASCVAPEGIESRLSVGTSVRTPRTGPGKVHILAIGVGRQLDNDIENLKCTENDAKVFLERLAPYQAKFMEVREHKLLAGAPTRAEIDAALEKSLDKAGEGDRVWIFFAGHGYDESFDRETGRGGKGPFYLVPADGHLMDRKTLIHLAGLMERVVRSPAAEVVVLLDACFSGGAVALLAEEKLKQDWAAALTADRPRFVLAGSAASAESYGDKSSLGHGLFTYAVLEGLGGKADGQGNAGKDGVVDIKELGDFVGRRVPALAKDRDLVQSAVAFGGGLVPVSDPGAVEILVKYKLGVNPRTVTATQPYLGEQDRSPFSGPVRWSLEVKIPDTASHTSLAVYRVECPRPPTPMARSSRTWRRLIPDQLVGGGVPRRLAPGELARYPGKGVSPEFEMETVDGAVLYVLVASSKSRLDLEALDRRLNDFVQALPDPLPKDGVLPASATRSIEKLGEDLGQGAPYQVQVCVWIPGD